MGDVEEPRSDSAPLAGMRICIVYDCLFPLTHGGIERWYRELSERLASAGAEVTYLTRRQWDDAAPTIPGVTVVAVAGRAELYDAYGGRRVLPPLGFGLGVLAWLARHRSDIDVVHVANFPFFSLMAARAATVASRVAVYADWYEIWPAAFWRSYAGPVAGSVGAVIQRACVAMSPHAFVYLDENARRLRAAGMRGEIMRLGGLLPTGEAISAGATAHRAPPMAIFVGRHVRDKGISLLPAIMARARELVPDLEMTVVGDGPLRAATEAEAAARSLTASMHFVGRVTDERLATLMAAAACTVVPSVREGYGLVVVESCAYGTPVVVARNPENLATTLVDEGRNGTVTAPDAAAVAAGIAAVVAAGAPLQQSTRAWYEANAPYMGMAVAAGEVVSIYATRRPSGPPQPSRGAKAR